MDVSERAVKVAVIGGGCAAMAAAWELSRPEHAGRYEVTVFQEGWRLGGKGASGRGANGRIEEHGLHIWLGFYDNAFRMLRECHAELEALGDGDLFGDWRDAFVPENDIALLSAAEHGGFERWDAHLPPRPGLPGDPLDPGEVFSLRYYMAGAFDLLRALVLDTTVDGRGLADDRWAQGDLKGLVDYLARLGRFATAAAYQSVYQHAHGAPQRLREFTCALPEHLEKSPTAHVAHPGCFATAMLLASVPLLKLGLVAPTLFVSGITGSTGSGRKPVEGTHHPLRHGDLYAYNALAHRHAPEVTACALAASGVEADFAFVPHSGPFARGIHVTVQGALRSVRDSVQVLEMLREFYADSPFVHVTDTPPRVKNVATSNYAHLSAVADGRTVAVMCVLDNLTKGAAGGAVQWMNRLFDLPETSGLLAPAPGWT